MIHIYFGDGKGKTSAAVGMAVRCAGREQKVLFVQFLKSSDTGERKILAKTPNVTLAPCPDKAPFTWEMNREQRQKISQDLLMLFESTAALAIKDRFRMVIFDEIFTAVSEKMFPEQDLYSFIADAPETLEVVMTGREASEKFIALADYASEVRCIKHPMDKGVGARVGIEY